LSFLNKNKPWCRVFICLVCALTLLGLFCRPISVSAADATTIRIVKDGSTFGELPPELIPFFLILIGLDYYYDHVPEITAAAERFYQNANSTLQKWANESFPSLAVQNNGAILLEPSIIDSFNEALTVVDSSLSITTSNYLVVPATYASGYINITYLVPGSVLLSDLSHVLGVTNENIIAGNSIASDQLSVLSTIKSLFVSTMVDLNDGFDTLTADLNSVTTVLNNNMMNRLDKISEDFGDLRSSLTYRLDYLTDIFTNKLNDSISILNAINSNINTRFDNLSSKVASQTESLTWRLDSLKTAISTLGTKIDTIPGSIDVIGTNIENRIKENKDLIGLGFDKIDSAIDDFGMLLKSQISENKDVISAKLDILIGSETGAITSVDSFATVTDQVAVAENALKDSTGSGKDGMYISLNNGEDALTKFANVFLALAAILNLFFNIPIIKDLLDFGLALGIFALFVNLGNTISRSGSSAVKAKKIGKGG